MHQPTPQHSSFLAPDERSTPYSHQKAKPGPENPNSNTLFLPEDSDHELSVNYAEHPEMNMQLHDSRLCCSLQLEWDCLGVRVCVLYSIRTCQLEMFS